MLLKTNNTSNIFKNKFPSLRGEAFVLRGNRITARFALLCLVAFILKAHHVVPHAETSGLGLTIHFLCDMGLY